MDLVAFKHLLTCECPFRWKPRIELEATPDGMISRLKDQLNEKVFEDDFQFEYLMLFVGLSYEYAIDDKIEDAWKTLEIGEEKLRKLDDDKRFLNMYPAFLHIMMATKVNLLIQKEDADTAAEVMSNIPSITEMNIHNQASLYGLRAIFFGEYGIEGSKRALRYSSKAIELDPNESLWHFFKGKYLSRIRRVEQPYDIPSENEIKHLEYAMKQEEIPTYIVFTAQTYREVANRVFRTSSRNRTLYPKIKLEIDELNEKSLMLYKKCYELKPDCSHMLFRCAKGFMQLPVPHQDVKLAKELLDKGLRMAPDSGYGNHVMAQYYERIQKDPHTAMDYLRICEKKNIFGAVMDLLRLERRLVGDTNIVKRLENLLPIYTEKSRQCQIYSQLVSHHIFVMNNLRKACEYAEEVIRLNPNTDDMNQHRPLSIYTIEAFNLYELLVDEIKIQKQNNNFSSEDEKYYDKFLDKLTCTGNTVSLTKPSFLKNQYMSVCSKGRTINKSNGNLSRNKNTTSKFIRALKTKTDIDLNMNNLFNKCTEKLKSQLPHPCSKVPMNFKVAPFGKDEPKFANYIYCASTRNNNSKSIKTGMNDTVENRNDGGGSNASNNIIKGIAEKKQSKPDEEVEDGSEDSDELTFRMGIYNKTKEEMKKLEVLQSVNDVLDEISSNSNKLIKNEGYSKHITKSMEKLSIREDRLLRDKSRPERPTTDHKNERATNLEKKMKSSFILSAQSESKWTSVKKLAKITRSEDSDEDFDDRRCYSQRRTHHRHGEDCLKSSSRGSRSSHPRSDRTYSMSSEDDSLEKKNRKSNNSYGRRHSDYSDEKQRRSKHSHKNRRPDESDEDYDKRSQRRSKHSHTKDDRRDYKGSSRQGSRRGRYSDDSESSSSTEGRRKRKSKYYERRYSDSSDDDTRRRDKSKRSQKRTSDEETRSQRRSKQGSRREDREDRRSSKGSPNRVKESKKNRNNWEQLR